MIEVSEVRDPEIIMIRAQRADDDPSNPRISVVPLNSADSQTIRALDGVAGALGPTETTYPSGGATLEGAAIVCPRCGHQTSEPLSRR